MNITLIKAHGTDISLEHFRKVYFEAFPADERRPWDDMTDKIHNGHDMFSAYMIMDGDTSVPLYLCELFIFVIKSYISYRFVNEMMKQMA